MWSVGCPPDQVFSRLTSLAYSKPGNYLIAGTSTYQVGVSGTQTHGQLPQHLASVGHARALWRQPATRRATTLRGMQPLIIENLEKTDDHSL